MNKAIDINQLFLQLKPSGPIQKYLSISKNIFQQLLNWILIFKVGNYFSVWPKNVLHSMKIIFHQIIVLFLDYSFETILFFRDFQIATYKPFPLYPILFTTIETTESKRNVNSSVGTIYGAIDCTSV